MLNNNPLTDLISVPGGGETWRWATVAQTSPVRVQLDGDNTPLLITPDSLVPVTTGDRVRVQVVHRRITIVGKLYAGADVGADSVVIGGTAYAASGTQACPAFSRWSYASNGVYGQTVAVPVPFTPPPGWVFAYSMLTTTGFTVAATAQLTANRTTMVRIIQFGNQATSTVGRLAWRLIRNK